MQHDGNTTEGAALMQLQRCSGETNFTILVAYRTSPLQKIKVALRQSPSVPLRNFESDEVMKNCKLRLFAFTVQFTTMDNAIQLPGFKRFLRKIVGVAP